jgi:hypothetical protein
MYNFLCLCILLCYSQVFANTPPSFSAWNTLSTIEQGEKITIKGFLYLAEDQWILSPEPNLRTCCVGVQHKKDSQIVLEGEFALNPYQVVHVEGIFFLNRVTGNYQLLQAHLKDSSSKFPWSTICIICMLAFCFFVYRYSHKRHDKKDLE